MNPVYLFAGMFVILSPFSLATESPFEAEAKFLRLASTAAMVLIAGFSYRCFRFRPAAGFLTAFVVFYTAAAVWSDLPLWGLFHKGMFCLTFLSGVGLAYSVRDEDELTRGLRLLGLPAALAAALVLNFYLRGASGNHQGERLDAFGINPNMIGLTAAALLILCAYLGLNERSRRWKILASSAFVVFAIVVVGTGSRASVAMGTVGCFILALPSIRRPFVLAGTIIAAGTIGYAILETIDLAGADRIYSSMARDTRSNSWAHALTIGAQSAIIGRGWLHSGTSPGNAHSIYLQVYLETGLIGVFVFGIGLLVLFKQATRMFRCVWHTQQSITLAWLALALTTGVLVHGIAESATLMGTTLNALWFGFGAGLIDRVPELSSQLVVHRAYDARSLSTQQLYTNDTVIWC